MATSTSSASKPRHLLTPYGTTAAPPPTPSTQPNLSSSDAADTLSRLLHRLPPSLSLPTRLSPRAAATTTTPTPTTPLPTTPSLSPLPSPAFELGYFQLAPNSNSSITPQLGESAESEALSLLDLPHDRKLASFPRDWPLGFDDEEDAETASLCLDAACSTTTTTTELGLSSLRELTRELEKVGLEVVESLARAVGFEKENPFGKKTGGVGPSSLMWISEGDEKVGPGRVYPYVVGVQYQIRRMKWSLLSDTGPVVVEPQVGSVLVTIGDIAQVWSNGKLKKVRGRPAAISEEKQDARCISMTLLLTLPHDSTISPLLTIPTKIEGNKGETEASNFENDKGKCKSYDHESIEANTIIDGNDNDEDHREFNSFSFEDYAWRVYHERLPLKDPLDRYRNTDQVLN